MQTALDLTRTRDAIAAYDRWDVEAWANIQALGLACTNEDIYAWQAEMERQRRLVGYTFWLDTQDRNSQSTCEGCLRPGDPWLRALVAKYELPKEGSDAIC